MKTILQTAEFGCGPASMAMLCKITLAEARQACGQQNWRKDGISENDLREAFSRCDHLMGEAEPIEVGRRSLFDIRDNRLLWGPIFERHQSAEWNESTGRAALKISVPAFKSFTVKDDGGANIEFETYDHWAVWDGEAQTIRDPYGYQSLFVPVYSYRISNL